jgi:hypothetical protein
MIWVFHVVVSAAVPDCVPIVYRIFHQPGPGSPVGVGAE